MGREHLYKARRVNWRELPKSGYYGLMDLHINTVNENYWTGNAAGIPFQERRSRNSFIP